MLNDPGVAHLLRDDQSSRLSAPLGLRWPAGDVGVEQRLDVVNKSVLDVNSGRLELEIDLR